MRLSRIIFVVPVLACLLMLMLPLSAQIVDPTTTPVPPPTPTPGVMIYSANGNLDDLYSDQPAVNQLYLTSNRTQPLTDRDRNYDQPRLSPDGSRIVYSVEGESLEIMDLDGSNVRQLAAVCEHSPAWEPDGAYLACASETDRAIYLIEPDGDGVTLLREGLSVRYLDFAPDGTRLLVSTLEPDEGQHVYIMSRDGTEMTPLLDSTESIWDAAWSPDGETIAYAARDGIYLTDDEGETSRRLRLTGGFMSSTLEERGYAVSNLAWSPAGDQLAIIISSWQLTVFVSTPVPFDQIGPQLAVVDIATGDFNLLTNGFWNSHPDWLPPPARSE